MRRHGARQRAPAREVREAREALSRDRRGKHRAPEQAVRPDQGKGGAERGGR